MSKKLRLLQPFPTKVSDLENDLPYTTMTKKEGYITIHCHNLKENKNYKLHLYTVSRKKGNYYGHWFHPNNYTFGYANLAGNSIAQGGSSPPSNPETDPAFPPIPDWMPNGGLIQTEWDIEENGKVKIYLRDFLKDMIKPINSTWDETVQVPEIELNASCIPCQIIGISNKAYAGRLFRFCIVDDTGVIYQCYNTLVIGGRPTTAGPRIFLCDIIGTGYYNIYNLYTSIR